MQPSGHPYSRGRHSTELVAQGICCVLWRPPLEPAMADARPVRPDETDNSEEVLASMPLRVWRSERSTHSFPHPNDPAGSAAPGSEYLTSFATSPAGTSVR